MKDVAVVAYCRTGIARATRGALNQTHGIPMTAHVLRHAVKRAGIDPAEVEDVVVGCGISREAQDAYVVQSRARVAAAAAAGKFAEEIVPFTTHDEDHRQGNQGESRRRGHPRSRPEPAPRHDARRPRRPQARVPGRHDDGGQRLAAVRRCGGRRHDGRRYRRASRIADPRTVSWHAAGSRRTRGDEHRDRARDPEAHEASPARNVGCRSVGAPRSVRSDHALQPGAARDAVGDHQRQRWCGAARPSVWHVGHSIPRVVEIVRRSAPSGTSDRAAASSCGSSCSI